MQIFPAAKTKRSEIISLSLGTAMLTCFAILLRLPSFRGPDVILFLVSFAFASAAYVIFLSRTDKDNPTLKFIWSFAILFRVVLLLSKPTLSDDVYRYVWDGHLLNQGVNPYYAPVNSSDLDNYDTPLRELVSHDWMASPYLPAAQIYFGVVSFFSDQSLKAFQFTAIVFDLLIGWVILDILRLLKQPGNRIAYYLWNPLVIIEFAHSAHIDAFMIALIMAALWSLIKAHQIAAKKGLYLWVSVIAMAAATLTKGIPLILLPIFAWRWGWRRIISFFAMVAVAFYLSSIKAGWGLVGELTGRGVFGALRIYLTHWQFNSSLYQLGERLLTNFEANADLPQYWYGEFSSLLVKTSSFGIIVLASLIILWITYTQDKKAKYQSVDYYQYLLILATIPIGLFLLLSATVHPWYITIMVPFIAFFISGNNCSHIYRRYVIPWLFISLIVPLSYFAYYDIDDFHENPIVAYIEYVPFYGLLIWASIPALKALLLKIKIRQNVRRV